MRGALLAGAATLALIAAFAPVPGADAAVACASGEPCVTVTVVGAQQSSSVVTRAQVLAGDVTADYEIRSVTGGSTIQNRVSGISVRSLLRDDVGLSLADVTFVETTVGSSQPMTLSPAQLGDPNDPGYPFPSGLLPVVYAAGPDQLGYLRPLLDDDQPNDFAQTASNGEVRMVAHTSGSLLSPVVAADAATVAAGGTVAFTTTFATAPTTPLSYSWDFGDGSSSADAATASHVYAEGGSYDARLVVRGDDGSLGIAAPVRITVTAPPATAQPTPSPTPTPSSTGGAPHPRPSATATTGPDRGTGHTPGGAATGAPVGSAPVGPGPMATPTSTPTATPTAISTPSPSPTADGTAVTGVLISGGGASPGGGGGAAQGGPASAPSSGTSPGLGWGAPAAAASVALLGAGVLLESGAFAHRRIARRRRMR